MENLTDLAQRAGAALQKKGWMLSTAESLTGGSISQAITDIAGSSGWFDRGYVTYSNAAKTECLDVSTALLAQHGAVSVEVAAAMAAGALANSHAQVSLSTTGIAGPAGAVPGKPVGTVCFGWAAGNQIKTERVIFSGDRHAVREQTAIYALQGLLKFLEKN